MDQQQLRNRKIKQLLAVALLLCGIVLAWQIYSLQKFHVVNTNPKTSNVTILTPFLKVNFNDKLSAKDVSVSSSDKGLISTYTVSGKTLTIKFNSDVLSVDKTYDVTIRSIQNVKGEQIVGKKFKFTPTQSTFDKLPQDQQSALLSKQDAYNNSPLVDPIVKYLPHGTLDYNLSTLLTTDANGKQTLVLEAQLLLSQSDVNTDQDAAIAQYKQEVTDYIQSLGLDPAKYTIQYSVSAS